MGESITSYLECSACGGELREIGGALTCAGCGVSNKSVGGFYDFVGGIDDNFDYIKSIDFHDLEDFKTLNSLIDERGLDAGKEEIKDRFPLFYRYLFEEGRSDWRFYMGLPEEAKVLDLGAGWGNLSFEFSLEYRHVVSVDFSPSKLGFMATRKRLEGRENMDLFRLDINKTLPFKDGSFDLVILNGVLEWVGEYHEEKAPDEYQRDLIREIRRLLKPGGYLYIGIENRFGFKYFLGYIDDHPKLKYTTLMPRRLADMVSNIQRGKGYRTYTYSYKKLRQFVEELGFDVEHMLIPEKDYRYYTHLFPADEPGILKFFYKRSFENNPMGIGFRFMHLMGAVFPSIFKKFVLCYSVIARKGDGI